MMRTIADVSSDLSGQPAQAMAGVGEGPRMAGPGLGDGRYCGGEGVGSGHRSTDAIEVSRTGSIAVYFEWPPALRGYRLNYQFFSVKTINMFKIYKMHS
jgi:hypothetical protein